MRLGKMCDCRRSAGLLAMLGIWFVTSSLLAQQPRLLHTFSGEHAGMLNSMALSADGQLMASGSEDATVKLWNVGTGKATATLKGHAKAVTSVALSADGATVASGSDDKTVKIWNLLASGSYDMTVKQWELSRPEKSDK